MILSALPLAGPVRQLLPCVRGGQAEEDDHGGPHTHPDQGLWHARAGGLDRLSIHARWRVQVPLELPGVPFVVVCNVELTLVWIFMFANRACSGLQITCD